MVGVRGGVGGKGGADAEYLTVEGRGRGSSVVQVVKLLVWRRGEEDGEMT